MLFEEIDRQLLALIANNATIDVIYNRFVTDQQCYQPLQNNSNITICDAFINNFILNDILVNLNTRKAEFNINPAIDIHADTSAIKRTCKIFDDIKKLRWK